MHDRDRLVEAGTSLVHADADLRQFLRNAGRGADLQPAAGEMVEHADLFDQLPRRVVGRHHAKDAEPHRLGAERDVGDQEVGGGRVASAEMMFGEENAFEAGRFGAGPKIEIGVEKALRGRGVEPFGQLERRCEKLEYPGFDHSTGPRKAAKVVL